MVIILVIKVGILIIVAMNHVMQYVKSELKCMKQTSTLTSGFDFSFYKSPCHQERLRSVQKQHVTVRTSEDAWWTSANPFALQSQTLQKLSGFEKIPRTRYGEMKWQLRAHALDLWFAGKWLELPGKQLGVSESSAAEPGCSVRRRASLAFRCPWHRKLSGWV